MNAIGMLFQSVQSPKTLHGDSKGKTTGENTVLFQSLLGDVQTKGEKATGNRLQVNDHGMKNTDNLLTDLREFLSSMVNGSDELESYLNKLTDEANPESNVANIDNMLAELQSLKNMTTGSEELEKMLRNYLLTETKTNSTIDNFVSKQVIPSLGQGYVDEANMTQIQKQFTDIFAKVEAILTQMSNQKDITKAAPKILELLQQWTALEKRMAGSHVLDAVNGSLKNEASKEQTVWNNLLQAFQKRNQLAQKQQYNSDAKVTNVDVAKWISKALDNHGQIDRVIGHQTITTSTQPISRLEQYVIHLNQTQSSHTNNQQVIEQFEKIMKSSRFLSMPNGTNQLNITLRPDNLGEMMVRFTQINGEMAVKIMVTSQAAKEMLESNMHQLRNMFSPHQVVVEKQEATVQQGQDVQKGKSDEQLADHEQNQSEHSDKDDKQQSGNNFETKFQDLLMNEKV
ncbi:hypothetical protein CIL05_08995 [Virgibacillus profundi]|uniref:Flagellar hook-length control protein-like C-terminal domain-containing protein n=1 Tax=Virgibacillus profundi TaxID=2024555 RepID=A0A2A2IFJ2_9BACI|nr:flagellar hook-length control protein FliK [Virgibacillus profundi]PAV30004.1 hypothetical protein CIL05_08995 [Virgibacillus profundi]PXY54177.1 hypothetical protein CIT14_09080 [Virgibacillus profundi]